MNAKKNSKNNGRGEGFISGKAGNLANSAGKTIAWIQFILAICIGTSMIIVGISMIRTKEKNMKQTKGIVTNVTGPVLRYQGSGRNKTYYNEWTVSYSYSLPSDVTMSIPTDSTMSVPADESEPKEDIIYKGMDTLKRQVNVGDTIDVYYNTNSPNESYLKEQASPKWIGGGLICMGVTAILVYSVMLYIARKSKTGSQGVAGLALWSALD